MRPLLGAWRLTMIVHEKHLKVTIILGIFLLVVQ